MDLNYIKSSLTDALKKSPTYTPNHILIPYIDKFDEYIGSAQIYTVNFAHRLGLDYDLGRYKELEDVGLREVIYYELLNYILYSEPNLKSKGFPSTDQLVKMTAAFQFKDTYVKFKLGDGYTFSKSDYRKRMSLITDYFSKI